MCAGVHICGKKCAKGLKLEAFVDHKSLKVGHVARGMDDGSFLDSDEHNVNVCVGFFHPKLTDPHEQMVSVMLDGVMWNKAERRTNTEPLPRIVALSAADYSQAEAIAPNEKMADGRQRHCRFIQSAWTTPEMERHEDDLTRLRPLF
eukprot:2438792-Rhodomonas_salina.1